MPTMTMTTASTIAETTGKRVAVQRRAASRCAPLAGMKRRNSRIVTIWVEGLTAGDLATD